MSDFNPYDLGSHGRLPAMMKRTRSNETDSNSCDLRPHVADLAARVAELEAENAKLRRYYEVAEEIRVTVNNTLAFRIDDLDAARAEVDKP